MLGAASIIALCGTANANDDAAAICKAAASAFEAAVASGNPYKLAATYAPDGEVVNLAGILSGPDEIAAVESTSVTPGAKATQNVLSSRMVGDVALCSGQYTFTFASGTVAKGYSTSVVRKVGNDWKTEVRTYNVTPGQ
jgi:ketosteroid isomerase-like protein